MKAWAFGVSRHNFSKSGQYREFWFWCWCGSYGRDDIWKYKIGGMRGDWKVVSREHANILETMYHLLGPV